MTSVNVYLFLPGAAESSAEVSKDIEGGEGGGVNTGGGGQVSKRGRTSTDKMAGSHPVLDETFYKPGSFGEHLARHFTNQGQDKHI